MFGKTIVDENGNPILNEDGTKKSEPHYVYTMKQAIEEHFILDVLKYYPPYQTYNLLDTTAAEDPLVDKNRAQRFLRSYVDNQPYAVKEKAGIMLSIFIMRGKNKIGGQGRAMVVTGSIQRAIEYYIRDYRGRFKLGEANIELSSPFPAMPIITGKHSTKQESNVSPGAQIEKKIQNDPYRILVVADKFQTGYDEPLLHTMYVDKGLADIKAVQTLSRLNRCYSGKNDVFVLDFANDPQLKYRKPSSDTTKPQFSLVRLTRIS
jgi:type I restriction enzyme R subunit